jgi:hypothetical protein
MTTKLSLFVVCCMCFCGSGFAQQVDASTLRAKYGEPLDEEVFHVRPNMDIVVAYGPGRRVCHIDLPQIRLGISTQQVDEVIDELVPPSARGKEIGRRAVGSGRVSMASVDYEHVSIAGPLDPDHPTRRTSVTITFNRPDCRPTLE